jgi:hypothetical protein
MARHRDKRIPIPTASVLLGLLVFAASLTTASDPAGAEPAGEEVGGRTVAILDLVANNVSGDTARGIVDSLGSRIERTGEFSVMERTDIIRPLEGVESGLGTVWFCDDITCALDIGRKVRVASVMFGSVSRLGKLVTISVRAVNVYTGKVVGEWTGKSRTGEKGIPDAVGRLASDVIRAKGKFPRFGERRFPGDLEKERARRSEDFETTLRLGGGTGVYGSDGRVGRCYTAESVTVCRENTADLTWIVSFGVGARVTDSRWMLGFRGGVSSAKTTYCATYKDSVNVDYERGEDSGLHFHLCPQVGYTLHESTTLRITALTGVGYRSFAEDAEVARSFLSAGLAVRIHMIRADLAYWRAIGSKSLLGDMITLDVGIGIGF